MKILYQVSPVFPSNTHNREQQPRKVLPTRQVEKKLSFADCLAKAMEGYK